MIACWVRMFKMALVCCSCTVLKEVGRFRQLYGKLYGIMAREAKSPKPTRQQPKLRYGTFQLILPLVINLFLQGNSFMGNIRLQLPAYHALAPTCSAVLAMCCRLANVFKHQLLLLSNRTFLRNYSAAGLNHRSFCRSLSCFRIFGFYCSIKFSE